MTESGLKVFSIEPRISRFIVRAFAGGIGAGLSYGPTLAIREYWGEATFDPATLENASLWLKIKAASITIAEDMRDDDRRDLEKVINQEVLHTSNFPEVDFVSTNITPTEVVAGVYSMDVVGQLTLNGETRRHSFSMRVSPIGAEVRAFGDFSIRQSDYGIQQISVAGGLLELQDELKFSFYIVARLKEASVKAQDA